MKDGHILCGYVPEVHAPKLDKPVWLLITILLKVSKIEA
jgi:hypothetical protein